MWSHHGIRTKAIDPARDESIVHEVDNYGGFALFKIDSN